MVHRWCFSCGHQSMEALWLKLSETNSYLHNLSIISEMVVHPHMQCCYSKLSLHMTWSVLINLFSPKRLITSSSIFHESLQQKSNHSNNNMEKKHRGRKRSYCIKDKADLSSFLLFLSFFSARKILTVPLYLQHVRCKNFYLLHTVHCRLHLYRAVAERFLQIHCISNEGSHMTVQIFEPESTLEGWYLLALPQSCYHKSPESFCCGQCWGPWLLVWCSVNPIWKHSPLLDSQFSEKSMCLFF